MAKTKKSITTNTVDCAISTTPKPCYSGRKKHRQQLAESIKPTEVRKTLLEADREQGQYQMDEDKHRVQL